MESMNVPECRGDNDHLTWTQPSSIHLKCRKKHPKENMNMPECHGDNGYLTWTQPSSDTTTVCTIIYTAR